MFDDLSGFGFDVSPPKGRVSRFSNFSRGDPSILIFLCRGEIGGLSACADDFGFRALSLLNLLNPHDRDAYPRRGQRKGRSAGKRPSSSPYDPPSLAASDASNRGALGDACERAVVFEDSHKLCARCRLRGSGRGQAGRGPATILLAPHLCSNQLSPCRASRSSPDMRRVGLYLRVSTDSPLIGPVLIAVPFLGRLHREIWGAVAESAPPPANDAEMQKQTAAAVDQPAPTRAGLVKGRLVLRLCEFGGSGELRRSDHGGLGKNTGLPWHLC